MTLEERVKLLEDQICGLCEKLIPVIENFAAQLDLIGQVLKSHEDRIN